MNIFTMESANLFCGDHDPSKSLHLVLGSLKLPNLEEATTDHLAGGAPVAIDIDTHLQKLEASFDLLGWTDHVQKMIGDSRRDRQVFTAYGLMRDRRTGQAKEAKAVMQGRLGAVNMQEYRRGGNQGHDYAIKSIVHYELYFNNTELFFWDFFTSVRRAGGEDLNADHNRILRIPASV